MLAKWRPNIFLLTTERAKCDMHAKQIAKETGARLECQFADLSDFESLEVRFSFPDLCTNVLTIAAILQTVEAHGPPHSFDD